MKTIFLILIVMISTALACTKTDQAATNSAINGVYIGTFERGGTTANVELNFNNGLFSGESDLDKFPAICNGTYQTAGNKVTFINDCIWTANFDWTLILNGEWTFNLNDKSLTMTKENGDQYSLTKQ